MSRISGIFAQEILDSRGNPMIEVGVWLEDGRIGLAAVSSGSSTGSRETRELRDGEPARYGGKSVLHAIRNAEHVNFVTHPRIPPKGIEQGIANVSLIKLNQAGTITETVETRLARRVD